jgi:hypothetical protein
VYARAHGGLRHRKISRVQRNVNISDALWAINLAQKIHPCPSFTDFHWTKQARVMFLKAGYAASSLLRIVEVRVPAVMPRPGVSGGNGCRIASSASPSPPRQRWVWLSSFCGEDIRVGLTADFLVAPVRGIGNWMASKHILFFS